MIQNELKDETIHGLIVKFPFIESLSIQNIQEDVDFELFKICNKIQQLKLNNLPHIMDSNIRRLIKKLNLIVFHVSKLPHITQKSFENTKEMKTIQEISIGYCWELTNETLLKLPISMKTFVIEGQNLRNFDLIEFVENFQLTSFEIKNCQGINPQMMVKLKKMKSNIFNFKYNQNEEDKISPSLIHKPTRYYVSKKIKK